MSRDSSKLKAGEHYGSVFHRRRTPGAFFSESVYTTSMDLPAHSHELGFFTLILDGYYSEILTRRTVVYTPRTVLWRQADLMHKDKIEADSSRFFFVEIERSFADRLRDCENVPDHFAEKNGQLTWLASRLRSTVTTGDDPSGLIAEGITLEMLGNLTRARFADKQPPKWLLRVVDRLNDEFAVDIPSEELGREADVHPVHLAATFRRFYGETMGEFVQKLRVERAKAMLAETKMSLAEIAGECGFADQSHFTRVFKKQAGVTPGAFRRFVT
jgi:AraC family transcriptional regulator